MKHRPYRLFLAAALVTALLAACASGTDTPSGSGAASGSDAAPVSSGISPEMTSTYGEGVSQETIGALMNSGKITVYTTTADFANDEFDNDPVMQKYNDWSRKYYGLTVRYRYRGWSANQLEKFMTDYAAGDAPDLFVLNYYTWPKIAFRDVLYTVEDLRGLGVLGLDHPILTQSAELAARYRVGDKQYAVAAAGCFPILCGVNLDLFERYSIKNPLDYYKEGDWDMDAYVKCCKELTRTVGDKKVWGGFGWNQDWFLIANDGRMIDWNEDHSKLVVAMNDVKTLHALDTVRDLYMSGYVPNQGDSFFKRGQMGIFCAESQNLAFTLKDCTFRWDVVPFPLGADNTSGNCPGAPQAHVVVSSSKNPQGAVNYMISRKMWAKYLRESDLTERMIEAGELDERQNAYNEPGWYTFDEEQVAMYEALENKVAVDLTRGTGTLALDTSFWNDLTQGKSVKECIDTYESLYREQCEFENNYAPQ